LRCVRCIRVKGLKFRILDVRFRVKGLMFRVHLVVRMKALGFRV